MKRIILLVVFTLATSLHGGATSFAVEIEVFFSPNGGAAHAVAVEIGKARKSVHVAAYAINETEITAAIIAAKMRSVETLLVVDPGQSSASYSTADKLKKAGVRTVADGIHQLHHNKYVIIDAVTVVTGSMNFTHSGEKKNAENVLIIRDVPLAEKYEANFREHYEHSSSFLHRAPRNLNRSPAPPNLILPSQPAHN
jgi:phosphatidylserine/phosphatidylglycerophosphate/cardiolipin synthase-like enzyme